MNKSVIKPVRKAVIPVAGLGTRFLPATKSIPKEMLPLVDRPLILHIVEEAVEAGIEEIIFVTGRHKSSLEDFFDRNYELEDTLAKQDKLELLKIAKYVSELCRVVSVRQKDPLGLGHAVLCAKSVVGDEPFAVLLGDEVMDGSPNVTKQLVDTYLKTGKSTVAVMNVEESEVKKYGIAELKSEIKKKSYSEIIKLIEKPNLTETKSRWALPGRYVFTSTLFKVLEEAKPGRGGEIQLTDAMATLAETEGLLGYNFDADRYDAGDKLGFVCANIEFGLKHPEIGEDLKKYIKILAERL